jgi:hypothetical protein
MGTIVMGNQYARHLVLEFQVRTFTGQKSLSLARALALSLSLAPPTHPHPPLSPSPPPPPTTHTHTHTQTHLSLADFPSPFGFLALSNSLFPSNSPFFFTLCHSRVLLFLSTSRGYFPLVLCSLNPKPETLNPEQVS